MTEEMIRTKICGIVMPIASMDDCPEGHWAEVKQIIVSVVDDLGYECKLVSEETDVGVIQKRIVQNLYDNDLIICDVSCRNANVMFELGMRLAFDKPVILIKDDMTPYSFDTSPVEHLTYRRDLRFPSINDFKFKLSQKIKAVMEGNNSESFLSSFGKFKVAELKEESVGPFELISEELASLKKLLTNNRSEYNVQDNHYRDGYERRNYQVNEMSVFSETNTVVVRCTGTPSGVKHLSGILVALEGVAQLNVEHVREKHTISMQFEVGYLSDKFIDKLVHIIKPDRVQFDSPTL